MSQLEPAKYQDAVEKAHQIAGSDRITADHVSQAVKEIRSKEVFLGKSFTPPALPYRVGEIVLLAVRSRCQCSPTPSTMAAGLSDQKSCQMVAKSN